MLLCSSWFVLSGAGVICNSQGESSRSGFRALERVWPEIAEQLRTSDGGQKGDGAPAWCVHTSKQQLHGAVVTEGRRQLAMLMPIIHSFLTAVQQQ